MAISNGKGALKAPIFIPSLQLHRFQPISLEAKRSRQNHANASLYFPKCFETGDEQKGMQTAL